MRIALAYGSRGTAYSHSHYDPVRKVISLTKVKGAGNLAFEYVRAFDDFLGELCGKTTNLSSCMTNCSDIDHRQFDGTTRSIETAMHNVLRACIVRSVTGQEYVDEEKDNVFKTLRDIDIIIKPYFDKIKEHVSELGDVDFEFIEKYDEFQKKWYSKEAFEKYFALYEEDIDMEDLPKYRKEALFRFDTARENEMHEEVRNAGRNIPGLIYRVAYNVDSQLEQYKLIYRRYRKNLNNEVGVVSTKLYRFYGQIYRKAPDIQGMLFARVMENYISRKLNSEGIRSDYLVCFADNDSYDKMYHVYPDEDEIKNIDRAIETLLDVVRKIYPDIAIDNKEREEYNCNYVEDTYQYGKELMGNVVKESIIAGMSGELKDKKGSLGVGKERTEGTEVNCRLYVRNKVSSQYRKLCEITKDMSDASKCKILVKAYMDIGVPNIELGLINNKRGNSQAYDIINNHLRIDYHAENCKKAEAVIEACSLLLVNSNAKNMTSADRWIIWNEMVVIICKVMGIDVRTYLVDNKADNLYERDFEGFKKLSDLTFTMSKQIVEQIYKEIVDLKVKGIQK